MYKDMSFSNLNAPHMAAGGGGAAGSAASASASASACDSYSSAGAASDNVLVIKTVQIAPVRTMMCALKEILIETNITFQKDGIRIINMDKSHTMLAHMFLESVNFELYGCVLPWS